MIAGKKFHLAAADTHTRAACRRNRLHIELQLLPFQLRSSFIFHEPAAYLTILFSTKCLFQLMPLPSTAVATVEQSATRSRYPAFMTVPFTHPPGTPIRRRKYAYQWLSLTTATIAAGQQALLFPCGFAHQQRSSPLHSSFGPNHIWSLMLRRENLKSVRQRGHGYQPRKCFNRVPRATTRF